MTPTDKRTATNKRPHGFILYLSIRVKFDCKQKGEVQGEAGVLHRFNYLLNLNPTKVIIVKYVGIINVKRRGHQREMQADWRNHIVSTPDVLRGKPQLKGTRITVSLILGYLAAGRTIEEFPGLTEEPVAACLDYACNLTEYVGQGFSLAYAQ